MAFGDMLKSSWKLYRLEWKTIVTIVFLCSFLPLVATMLLSQGAAQALGVTGTVAQYEVAQDQYQLLAKSVFLGGASEATIGALQTQRMLIAGLQETLLPYFGVRMVLHVIAGFIGLWGMLALLLGFFGSFKSASTLLRDARARYWSFLGAVLALVLVVLLGGIVLCVGLVLLLLLAGSVASVSSLGGILIGVVGGIAIGALGMHWWLGICFTLYEAAARKLTGFNAVRASWTDVKRKRWFILGQSILVFLTVLCYFLPLLLIQFFLTLGTFGIAGEGVGMLIQLLTMFIAMPVLYFFFGFLYKRL